MIAVDPFLTSNEQNMKLAGSLDYLHKYSGVRLVDLKTGILFMVAYTRSSFTKIL